MSYNNAARAHLYSSQVELQLSFSSCMVPAISPLPSLSKIATNVCTPFLAVMVKDFDILLPPSFSSLCSFHDSKF